MTRDLVTLQIAGEVLGQVFLTHHLQMSDADRRSKKSRLHNLGRRS